MARGKVEANATYEERFYLKHMMRYKADVKWWQKIKRFKELKELDVT